ncbi:hypothetical protein Q7A53_08820 [Halobacillus rhizosphaerae]|uniref:hypothetical protein n=1 Tax=Halobacillus rhizosphaerae TaxID=3064889 RepID=UPI00398B10F6
MKIRKDNIINYIIAIIFIILAIVLVVQLSINSNSESKPSIKEEAQGYLKEKFAADTKVVGIYHASLEYQPFETAARVVNSYDHVQFYVYKDRDNKLVDTYISSKWEQELTRKLKPYIQEHIKGYESLFVHFDENSNRYSGVIPKMLPSIKDSKAIPSIRLELDRKPETNDEQRFEELVNYLRDEYNFTDGDIKITYFKDSVPLDKVWQSDI